MFDVCCVSVEAQDCIVNSVALSFMLHMDEQLSRGDPRDGHYGTEKHHVILCIFWGPLSPLSPLLVEKMPNESDMIFT